MNSTHRHADQLFRDQTNLIRLVEHLEHAIEDIQHVGSAEELATNRILLNSVAMEITQAQECARKLSEEYRNSIPESPWNKLRGLRNALVHDYDEIDVEALYNTVRLDVPKLAGQLRPIVDAIA